MGEKELGLQNAKCVSRMIQEGRGLEVMREVKAFSLEGRAAKQNPTLFVLALCARQDSDPKTKKAAYEALPEVCRIPTHLFSFVEYSEALSRGTGWGRAHRRALSQWYNRFSDNPRQLAQHVTKYRNRNGWTHKDVLRLCHVTPQNEGVSCVVKHVIKGLDVAKQFVKELEKTDEEKKDEDIKETFEVVNMDDGNKEANAKAGKTEESNKKKEEGNKKEMTEEDKKKLKQTVAFLEAVEKAKESKDADEVIQLIQRQGLVREHVPTMLLNDVTIWRQLLQKMPMTAMIRNLGKMTSLNLLQDGEPEVDLVVKKLGSVEALKIAKIHPFNVLVALLTYKQGKGDKGKLKWTPSEKICKALDDAFYASFKLVEPTNQRFCLAVDVSGSMSWGSVNGCSAITPRDAAAALTMVTARTEPQHEIMGFSHTLVPVPINKDMNLDEVTGVMQAIPMGGTDCALPMVWAKEKQKDFDVFIVYTDNETWFGKIHPAEALREYRKARGIWDAKLIVCGMASNGFTIADPEDPGMLDMAGFDSAGPEVIRNFSLGLL